jgi:hypothetical protein
MGIDIYSGRGVIFTVDEFLKVINGKNKANVVAVCVAYSQELKKDAQESQESLKQNPDEYWRTELSASFKALRTLKSSMKLSEIREIINSTIKVGGEVAKYGDCWVENSEYAEDLFTRILDACPNADDLPHIQEVTAWGSGRNNGWDVPKGVACVVFDSENCFERKMNHHGEALKKVLGHCDETEWTEMSY